MPGLIGLMALCVYMRPIMLTATNATYSMNAAVVNRTGVEAMTMARIDLVNRHSPLPRGGRGMYRSAFQYA